MRSPEPSFPTPTTRTSKVWLAGAAIGVAVLGAAAVAQADGTPSPSSSDDAAYQAGTPSESAPSGLVADGKDARPDRPADLTPEEVQSLVKNAKAANTRTN
jgi:hypothetical protein